MGFSYLNLFTWNSLSNMLGRLFIGYHIFILIIVEHTYTQFYLLYNIFSLYSNLRSVRNRQLKTTYSPYLD